MKHIASIDATPGLGGGAVTRGAVVARIERLPPNAMQVRARLLVGTATFFDGFDAIAIATTLPLLIKLWALSPVQIGLLISGSAIGQIAGALLFPQLAQRYGRLRAIAWSTGLIGITSLLCAGAGSFEVFLVLRIVQGLGLGGELPVAASYINEITRAHGRGRFVLLYEVVYPIGLLVSTVLGAWLVPRVGWESMYLLGGLPLLLAFVLRALVPESPRWLAERGRMAEAEAALRRFEAGARGPLPPVRDADHFEQLMREQPRRSLRDLLGPQYLRRSVVVALLWASCGFIQTGLTAWLPSIYQAVHKIPLQLALNLAIGASALGVVGSLVSALTVDRYGRKPVICIAFVLCAATLGLAGLLVHHSVYLFAGLCSLAFGLLACGFITAFVYTPELYPTSIRPLGVGLGGVWAKIAAIVAPVTVASLTAGGRVDLAFYLLGAVPLLAAATVALWGVETRGKVLEELQA